MKHFLCSLQINEEKIIDLTSFGKLILFNNKKDLIMALEESYIWISTHDVKAKWQREHYLN